MTPSQGARDLAKVLFRMSNLLCRSPSPRPVLQDLLVALCQGVGAPCGLIALVQQGDSAAVELAAAWGPESERREALALHVRAGPSRWIIENDQAIVLPNGIRSDGRFSERQSIYDSDGPFIGLPIRSASGRPVGALEVQSAPHAANFDGLAELCEMLTVLIGQHNGAHWREEPAFTQDGAGVGERLDFGFGNLVGHTPAMRHVFAQIRQVAKWNTTVLIMGESGTGKELIANAIHYNSSRARGPFVKLNCAALTDNLLESELFGHEKGAFTGALTRHVGKFEQAHRGTLFLDEVGEISPAFQAKLLRVLQEGEYDRVGGTQTLRVDVRIIAATNRDLEAQVEENRFRQDLYYRLNVMPILTPALRERKDDIFALAEHLVKEISKAQGRPLRVTDSAVRTLMLHDWPGNVRELQNCLERAAIMSEEGLIDHDAVVRAGLPLERSSASGPSSVAQLDLRDPNIDERERLLAALERAGWVQAKAARLLGMTPRQVAYRIQTLKIDVPRF